MNAPLKITPAPVRKSIHVNAPQAKAFDVFTARIGAWWPKEHHVGSAPFKTAIIEPFAGGRWYHVSEDGSEGVMGRVLAWQPPAKLVLSWRLNSQFQFDDNVESKVEISFIAEGDNATRVELEHHITSIDAESIRTSVDSPNGWSGILMIYAKYAEGQ